MGGVHWQGGAQRSGAKDVLERQLQGNVDIVHRDWQTEIDKAGDAVAGIFDATRDNTRKVREIRLDVDRDAVQRDPALQADPDCGDLVLVGRASFRPRHPDADTILAPFAADIEGGEGANRELLKAGHIGADVRTAALEVEHQIDHPLPGTVIGELPTPARGEHRKACIDQVTGFCTGS